MGKEKGRSRAAPHQPDAVLPCREGPGLPHMKSWEGCWVPGRAMGASQLRQREREKKSSHFCRTPQVSHPEQFVAVGWLMA